MSQGFNGKKGLGTEKSHHNPANGCGVRRLQKGSDRIQGHGVRKNDAVITSDPEDKEKPSRAQAKHGKHKKLGGSTHESPRKRPATTAPSVSLSTVPIGARAGVDTDFFTVPVSRELSVVVVLRKKHGNRAHSIENSRIIMTCNCAIGWLSSDSCLRGHVST